MEGRNYVGTVYRFGQAGKEEVTPAPGEGTGEGQ